MDPSPAVRRDPLPPAFLWGYAIVHLTWLTPGVVTFVDLSWAPDPPREVVAMPRGLATNLGLLSVSNPIFLDIHFDFAQQCLRFLDIFSCFVHFFLGLSELFLEALQRDVLLCIKLLRKLGSLGGCSLLFLSSKTWNTQWP